MAILNKKRNNLALIESNKEKSYFYQNVQIIYFIMPWKMKNSEVCIGIGLTLPFSYIKKDASIN